MNLISVLAVVNNEQDYLEESFTLLKPYVSEFVVIDQGSIDDTVNIAKRFTDKVFLFPKVFYEGAYMAHAALMAKNEWVLKCNPDERWDKELLEQLINFIAEDYDIIRIPLKYINLQEPPYSYGARLWKRDKVLWTDSFDPVPYNADRLKQLYVEQGFITNLRSSKSSFSRYRLEGARRLLSRYGDTKVEPYANYCKYYKEMLEQNG